MNFRVRHVPGALCARARRFWFVLLIVPSIACSSALRGYDVAPNGLARNDARLRRLVATGHADSALARLQPSKRSIAPTDPVLRLLYQGTIAHHAGDYPTSVSAFDSATWLSDDRNVTSLSREAASLLSNDRALPYEPNRTERLFNAFYSGLGYLQMNNPGGAAVEARRISYILQTHEEEVDADEARLDAVMFYISGVFYEAVGDFVDAKVAYRNAAALLPSLEAPALADQATPTAVESIPADSGDVVLILEDGFVAHRVQHSLTLVLAPDERTRLHAHDREQRTSAADAVALRVLTHALRPARDYGVGPRIGRHDWFIGAPDRPRRPRCSEQPKRGSRDKVKGASRNDSTGASRTDSTGASRTDSTGASRTDSTGASRTDATGASRTDATPAKASAARNSSKQDDCDEDDTPYILRLAWPAYHADRHPSASGRVLSSDSTALGRLTFASVSDAVVSEYERERPKVLARTIARSVAKYALVKGAENAAGESNEGLGKLLGTIANVSGALLEQADTRSWTLIPAGIGITRVRLPVGTHDLVVVDSRTTHRVRGVRVEGGSVRVETVRAW